MENIEVQKNRPTKQFRPLLFALLVSSLMLFMFAALVSAETNAAVTLSVSKSVDMTTALPEDTLAYTIVVSASDSGDSVATFALTDTLPVSVTYVANSLSVSGDTSDVVIESGVLTATGTFFTSDAVQISFQVTTSMDTVTGTILTNIVYLDDMTNSTILSDSVATTIITATPSTDISLPIIAFPITAPTLSNITAPTGDTNEWTVSWSNVHSSLANATGYELQEATDADFTQNVTTTSLGLVNSTSITKDVGEAVTYYYRVRVVRNSGFSTRSNWSNVGSVVALFSFEYYEDFEDDSNPSNWRIVRQDTDGIANFLSISNVDPDYLDLRMESRYDYMIASNLTQVPDGAYILTARMRIQDADPRHAAGIILGADYDGSSDCPVSIENKDYSSCFTEYYRFMFTAGNTDNIIETQIKRIEQHSDTDNTGSGPELASSSVTLSGKNQDDWIEWSIEVSENGTMVLKLDGSTIHTVTDTEYQDNRYFGFWSSTSDTTLSNTQIDWVRVESN